MKTIRVCVEYGKPPVDCEVLMEFKNYWCGWESHTEGFVVLHQGKPHIANKSYGATALAVLVDQQDAQDHLKELQIGIYDLRDALRLVSGQLPYRERPAVSK